MKKFNWNTFSLIGSILLSVLLIGILHIGIDNNLTKNNAPTQEVVFTLSKVAIMRFSENKQFISASTISYFVSQRQYEAKQVMVYQYAPVANTQKADEQNQTSPLTPSYRLFSHAMTQAIDDNNIYLHRPVEFQQYDQNNTLKISAGDSLYHIDSGQLTSLEPITIHSPVGHISASSLNFNFIDQSFELLNQVHSVFNLNLD